MSDREDPQTHLRMTYPPAQAHVRQGRRLREVAVPVDASEALKSLGALEIRVREMESERNRAIGAAQREGATWDQIAAVLGVSRQAAWEKYRAHVLELFDATARAATATEEEALASAEEVLRDIRAHRRGG